jgi:site-specific recombinase XerD
MSQHAPPTLAKLIERFLVEHLPIERGSSGRTVESYATTLRLLLNYCSSERRLSIGTLRLEDWNAATILEFLKHLEDRRGCVPRTRNQRLAALKSFFKYVGARHPTSLSLVQPVLEIPHKRQDERLVGYLTREELEAVLEAANRPGWYGQRDHAMLLTAYFSAARVSEFTGMDRADADLSSREGRIRIRGKGRKERTVVLPPRPSAILRAWEAQLAPGVVPLFPGRAGERLTRSGAADRLRRAVLRASTDCGSLNRTRVSPHVLRHSMAMHLLENGVSLAAIALFLGHESLETTNKYLVASVRLKRQTLESLPPLGLGRRRPSRREEERLIQLLESLQRTGRAPSAALLAPQGSSGPSFTNAHRGLVPSGSGHGVLYTFSRRSSGLERRTKKTADLMSLSSPRPHESA